MCKSKTFVVNVTKDYTMVDFRALKKKKKKRLSAIDMQILRAQVVLEYMLHLAAFVS